MLNLSPSEFTVFYHKFWLCPSGFASSQPVLPVSFKIDLGGLAVTMLTAQAFGWLCREMQDAFEGMSKPCCCVLFNGTSKSWTIR